MSFDVRFKGTLTYASAKAAKAAVAALAADIARDEGGDSLVVPGELKVKGKAIAIDVDTTGPAARWEDTLAFVDVLARRAERGAIQCWFDGKLDETIAAPRKPRVAKPKVAKRSPPG